MAKQLSPHEYFLPGAPDKVTPIPGRTYQQGLDGDRSDPNRERSSSDQSTKEEQSSHPNQREHGGSGTGAPEAASPKRDRRLSEPSTKASVKEPESVNPFTASSNILETIAKRFNAARDTQKVGAWKQLQTDLMNASPFICPGLIPLKDLINICQDIEKEIKGANTQTGKSNEVLLSEFLNGKGTIALREEALDSGSIIDERDEESLLSNTARRQV